MDSFPDIRSFSVDELTAFLAALIDEAEAASISTDASFAYRRQVLHNKIDVVRAELSDRRDRLDPGAG
jgi:hypothetical protein